MDESLVTSQNEVSQALCDARRDAGIAAHFDGGPDPQDIESFQVTPAGEKRDCPFCRILSVAVNHAFPPSRSVMTRLFDGPTARAAVCQIRRLQSDRPELEISAEGSKGIRIRHHQHASGAVVDKAMDYERLRRLIDTCRDSHNRCDFDFNRGMGKLSPDTLFIDVKKLCLVQLPTPTAVFVALSYVWGDAVTFKTEQANRALLMEEGVFERLKDQIPKTIHDAMTLVRRLGFDFLWVDAFCIVQDDEEHKKKQIDNMSVIYSESILTIIALTASDAARGLAGVDNNSRPLKVVSVTENSSLSAHTQNLRVLRDSSVYKTRAWTFQEEVMSRRRLYITDWQYYLACLTETTSEEIWEGEDAFKVQDPFDLPLEGPGWMMRHLSDERDSVSEWFLFYLYCKCAEEFSARAITFSQDRANAFTSINSFVTNLLSSRIEQRLGGFNSGLAVGMPGIVMRYALLWVGPWNVEVKRPRNKHFPTWAWLGWDMPVEYDLAVHAIVQGDDCQCCFTMRHDYEVVDFGFRVRDILEVEGLLINAEPFQPGLAALNDVDGFISYPAEVVDQSLKYVGLLFDAELPAMPRRSACWFLALFKTNSPFERYKLFPGGRETLEHGCIGADPLSNEQADEQCIVMLLEETDATVETLNGNLPAFERLGVGRIALSAVRSATTGDIKQFVLK